MLGKSGGGILQVSLKDQAAIYEAFMPFLRHGGLFVRTAASYELGDEVFVLVTLPDNPEPVPIAARVVWVTPHGSSSHPEGIGIEFNETDKELYARIEAQIGEMLKSKKPTLTM